MCQWLLEFIILRLDLFNSFLLEDVSDMWYLLTHRFFRSTRLVCACFFTALVGYFIRWLLGGLDRIIGLFLWRLLDDELFGSPTALTLLAVDFLLSLKVFMAGVHTGNQDVGALVDNID